MNKGRLTRILESKAVASTWPIDMLFAQRQGMADSCLRQHHIDNGRVAILHFPTMRTSSVGSLILEMESEIVPSHVASATWASVRESC